METLRPSTLFRQVFARTAVQRWQGCRS